MSDSYGRIAALRPADTNEVELYECPPGTQVQAVLSVCNQASEMMTYRVAHCASGHGDVAANNEDFRAYDTEIAAGSVPHEYAFNLAAGETIRVRAGNADEISFVLEGLTMA